MASRNVELTMTHPQPVQSKPANLPPLFRLKDSMDDLQPSWAKIPFVPRPPISERSGTPGASPLTHIFDTNAIRSLGRLKKPHWLMLLSAWKARGYTTGWVPWTVHELTGSNLVRNGKVVPQRELEQIVLAVLRFYVLAEGDVLPDVDQLFVRSMYQLVGAPDGPSHFNEIEDEYRFRIHVCKQVTSRDQIGLVPDSKGSFFVGFNDGGTVTYQPFKSTFANHAPKAIANVKKLIKGTGLTKDSPDEDVAKVIQKDFMEMVLRKGKRLKVPMPILLKVAEHWKGPMMPDAPFTVSLWCETWYYYEFARERLTRAFKDNDGPDFKISAYMSIGDHFVMNDGKLRDLISRYMREPERRIIRPSRFYRTALYA